MIGNRDLKFEDCIQILRRRKWVIVVPALLSLVTAFAVSYAFPMRYTSQALLMVVQQQVPEGLVKPVVTEQLIERLATLTGRMESRARLLPIAERYGLLDRSRNHASDEEVLDDMRSAINVSPVQSEFLPSPIAAQVEAKTGAVPGFTISYTDSDPKVAQEVCSDLTSAVVDENLKLRSEIAQGTTEFFNTQVAEAKSKQDELDAQLAEFKRKYAGQLPDEQDENLKLLAAVNTQLDATTQALNRAQQDQTYGESLLDQQLAAWKAAQSLSGNNPETLRQQLEKLQLQLINLKARYTPEYPDIIKTQKDIDEIKRELSDSSATSSNDESRARATEPVELQKLRSQIHGYDQVIKQASAQQARLQEQARIYQARLETSPAVEEQYRKLTRDYAAAQKFYSELAAKQSDSAMAADMETRQQGEQFRISDPASQPVSPTFPNRPLFAGAGLGAGLALGLGLVLSFELRDQTLHTEKEVEAALELPTIVSIPWVGGCPADESSNRNRGNGSRPERDRDERSQVVGLER